MDVMIMIARNKGKTREKYLSETDSIRPQEKLENDLEIVRSSRKIRKSDLELGGSAALTIIPRLM
jgi:hypothetical protein